MIKLPEPEIDSGNEAYHSLSHDNSVEIVSEKDFINSEDVNLVQEYIQLKQRLLKAEAEAKTYKAQTLSLKLKVVDFEAQIFEYGEQISSLKREHSHQTQ